MGERESYSSFAFCSQNKEEIGSFFAFCGHNLTFQALAAAFLSKTMIRRGT